MLAKFYWPTYLWQFPWTRNCPNLYTHETHQPNLTYIQVVL